MRAVSLRKTGKNRLLAGKVGVDCSGRNTNLLRNLAVVGPVEPLAGKQFEGRSLNATLIFFGSLFGNLGHR